MWPRTTHRHAILCILPPHILHQIAQNGTPDQRAAALQTLATDHTFRTLRALRLAAPVVGAAPAPLAVAATHRTIFDTHTTQTLPGTVVRQEGGAASPDVAVNEAYDGLGDTFDFYWHTFGRNSIDGNGLPLNATVHYDQKMDNAFWDGQRMVFGDGDGTLFNRFTIALDVIGHELTHGVTEVEAQLIYAYQSGALNESLSDVFGSLVKQYKLGKQAASQADWLIGAGLFTPQVQGTALRSMQAPGTAFHDPVLGKDPQPAHMNNYVHTFQDNGGVHINSGIPNRAFYLVAVGIGGFAGDKAGRIWYDALRDPRLRSNSGFRRFARLAYDHAGQLFPGGPEQHVVRDAWSQVGIPVP